jgi:hypothetical protein
MDADAAGWTMRRESDRRRTIQWNQLADKKWVDGTTLAIKAPNLVSRPLLNAEPSTWHTLAQAGVYCESQYQEHCGTHALATIMMRQIVQGTNTLVPLLRSWMVQEGIHQYPREDWPEYSYFEERGWYSPEALNHWLYRMVDEPVTLYPFMRIEHGTLPSRQAVLSQAPEGCKAIPH